jgi:hypothetical protein
MAVDALVAEPVSRQPRFMTLLIAALVMATLAAFTLWLPLAAHRSERLADVLALLGAAGGCVPFHSALAPADGSTLRREVDRVRLPEVGGPRDGSPFAVVSEH